MGLRISPATVEVLCAMTEAPNDPHYGYSLMRTTGLKSGSLYPILERLENAGWVKGQWEPINEQQEGRPPRRYYRLTPLGQESAPQAIKEFARQVNVTLPSRKPQPAWGVVQ